MGGRGMAAHRPGARGRTPTQAQRKKELGPNHQVFSDAEKHGFAVSRPAGWDRVGQNSMGIEMVHFTKGDIRVSMVVNHPSGRVREATVGRKHPSGGHEVIDEIRVGSGNRRDRVRALLKKHGG